MAKIKPHATPLAERVSAELRNHPDGATDAALARSLGVRPQAVNGVCRKLAAAGRITRTNEGERLINRLFPAVDGSRASVAITVPPCRPWFWEGNVQATVVEALRARGWTITWQADTASRQRGKDIEATRDGETLWVTVKGFPAGTPRTRPTVQARHWFSHALFDVILWRDESPEASIAVALPDQKRYRSLAEKTTWFQHAAAFHFIWVTEAGVMPEGLEALAIPPATSSLSRLEPASRR